MASDFFLEPATFAIPTLRSLRIAWINIPDTNLREVIVREAQYLDFYRYILASIKHTASGNVGRPTYTLPIGFDLRAIALKTAIINSSSIMEAALLSHAIARKYKLPNNEKHRTFGNVLKAWELDEIGKNELGKYLILLKRFHSERNHIHLSIITKNDNYFKDLCEKESKYLVVAEQILKFLQKIKSILG